MCHSCFNIFFFFLVRLHEKKIESAMPSTGDDATTAKTKKSLLQRRKNALDLYIRKKQKKYGKAYIIPRKFRLEYENIEDGVYTPRYQSTMMRHYHFRALNEENRTLYFSDEDESLRPRPKSSMPCSVWDIAFGNILERQREREARWRQKEEPTTTAATTTTTANSASFFSLQQRRRNVEAAALTVEQQKCDTEIETRDDDDDDLFDPIVCYDGDSDG